MVDLESLEVVAGRSHASNAERIELKSDSWSNLFTGVGQIFVGGSDEVRSKLRKYSLYSGYKFKFKKNDRNRVSAYCAMKSDTGCSWKVHAYAMFKEAKLFSLKEYVSEHTCGGGFIDVTTPNLSKKLVSELIFDQVKDNPSVKPRSIAASFKRDYGVELNYYYAYHGKELALKELYGEEEKSYAEILWYSDALRKSNPGSHIVLEVDHDTHRFQRLFVAFEACIFGFNYCRPLLFLDGTHLNTKFKGILLSATGKDGDQGFFPYAFAIVSSEDDSNWKWFLENLKVVVNPARNITFFSDRNHGLLVGIKEVFPDSLHVYCYWHLKNNLKSLISNKNKKKKYFVWLFSRCAYATTHEDFNEAYSLMIRDEGPRVKEFLDSIPQCHWANLFFQGQRYGEMSSSLAESFNAWIKEERSIPISAMVDKIRIKMMKNMTDRREDCRSWNSILCPKLELQWAEEFEIGRTWHITKSSDFVYEIHSIPSHMVDLTRWHCSCGLWRMKGFPCAHAVCAIQRYGSPNHQFVDAYFTSNYFQASYSRSINPVPTFSKPAEDTNEFRIKPPANKRPPGRPKSKRIESTGNVVKKARLCGRCNKYVFHNRKTCSEVIS